MFHKDPFVIQLETFSLIQELQSLAFFDAIDLNIDSPIIKKPLPLSKIKARIIDGIVHLNKTF